MRIKGFGPELDGYADPSVDLERHVRRRTEAAVAAWSAEPWDTPDQVRAHQARIRAAVLAGIGGLPELPTEPPVVVHREPVPARPGEQTGGVEVERIVFESLPGVLVSALLHRPPGHATATAPGPAVVFACGHMREAKGGARYQIVCNTLAAAGLTVLAVDPHGQGERIGSTDHDRDTSRGWGVEEHFRTGIPLWWQGRSLMSYMVADLIRAVDLLDAMPEIDSERIGVTGNSGGGTQTTIAMALEPRLAAAAPGTYVTSRLAYQRTGQLQDPEQHLLGGTTAGVDHGDLLAVMAPRPVRVLAVSSDFFVIDGTRESITHAGRAFTTLGAPEALSCTVAEGTHSYNDELAAASAAFFADVFGLPAPAPAVGPHVPLPEEQAWTGPQGLLIADRPESVSITDLITRGASEPLDVPDPVAWLTDRVLGPREVPAHADVRWIGDEVEPRLFWRSETDVFAAGVLLPPLPADVSTTEPVLTLVLLDDGTATAAAGLDDDLVVGPAAGPCLVLDVRGTGALAVRARGNVEAGSVRSHLSKLSHDLLWLDDSLAAGRVYDIVRAADVLTTDPAMVRRWPGLDTAAEVHLVTGAPVPGLYAELASRVSAGRPAGAGARITKVRHTAGVLDPVAAARTVVAPGQTPDGWQALIPGLGRVRF
ncbi:acetylxylan esterase [Microlunatus sp. Y2014]|uniref:acetylxylan esterase n=1 Tax=Microlunatus sp. Y2014 TaxID=3418488 RepID=UPI003DA78D41